MMEKVNIRHKLQELELKLCTNEYIDERQTFANTHGLPARELPVCNTNSDEPLRFVWHQLKDMYISENSYIHGKEQKYWNEDRDSNPNTSSVGPLDSPKLYWGADRNRKTGITNDYQHHTWKRPLRRQARSLPAQPASQIKCKQTEDISCMNWNHCMNRGRLYIYMTNNHMYVHTKIGVGPCTCDTKYEF